jgi:hypothetical protein
MNRNKNLYINLLKVISLNAVIKLHPYEVLMCCAAFPRAKHGINTTRTSEPRKGFHLLRFRPKTFFLSFRKNTYSHRLRYYRYVTRFLLAHGNDDPDRYPISEIH